MATTPHLPTPPPSIPTPQPTPPSPPRIATSTTISATSTSSSSQTTPLPTGCISRLFCIHLPITHKKHLSTLLRSTILLLALTALILDIVSINFIHTHRRDFPLRFYNPSLKDEAFIPLVLIPDIMAVAMMTILMWETGRMRLPDRWWRWHCGARWIFGLLLVSVGAIEPAMEARYYATNGGGAVEVGVKEYFCIEPTRFWRRHGLEGGVSGRYGNGNNNGTSADGSEDANSTSSLGGWQNGNNGNGYGGGNSYYRSTNIKQCQLLRSRSILTFIWLLLVFLELCLAYSLGEFRARGRRRLRRPGVGIGLRSIGSTVGVDVVGGNGRNKQNTKRPTSTVSSDIWNEDQQQNQQHHQQTSQCASSHHLHDQQHNNVRMLYNVEEIDNENEDDEHFDDEENNYSYSEDNYSSSQRTSISGSSSSSRALSSQEWSRQQAREEQRDAIVDGHIEAARNTSSSKSQEISSAATAISSPASTAPP